MSLERGDVVFAADPFKDGNAGRPFLIINRTAMPFHGEQYLTLSLTTRTWHDERIPLADDMWIDGGAPKSSSILPWSVNSTKTEWIAYRQGALREDVVDQAGVMVEDLDDGRSQTQMLPRGPSSSMLVFEIGSSRRRLLGHPQTERRPPSGAVTAQGTKLR